MTPEDFDSLVPVSLNLGRGAPSIDWGDLRGISFSEPFFDQTIESWVGRADAQLCRTGLEALHDFDPAAVPEPAAFIFHLSRCGSTLASRLLATLPRLLVLSEPAPLNSLLMEETTEADPVQFLRSLVGVLGRARNNGEGAYVLKLSAWNVRKFAFYRGRSRGHVSSGCSVCQMRCSSRSCASRPAGRGSGTTRRARGRSSVSRTKTRRRVT